MLPGFFVVRTPAIVAGVQTQAVGWPFGHPTCGIGFGFVKECALNQLAKYSIAAVLYQYSAFAVSFRSSPPMSSAFAMYSPAFAVTV